MYGGTFFLTATLLAVRHNLSSLTGKSNEYINMGSYNYLGFAENEGRCAKESIECIRKYGVATLSPRVELGKCG